MTFILPAVNKGEKVKIHHISWVTAAAPDLPYLPKRKPWTLGRTPPVAIVHIAATLLSSSSLRMAS